MPPDAADKAAEANEVKAMRLSQVKESQRSLQTGLRGLANQLVAEGIRLRVSLATLIGIETTKAAASLSQTDQHCLTGFAAAGQQELIGALTAAVMLGEGLGKRDDDATANRLTLHHSEHQELQLSQIEAEADKAFQGMAASRKLAAKNYASLKAYVVSAGSHFAMGSDGHSFPRKWGSLTDLLMTIWAHSKLKDTARSVALATGAQNTPRPLFWQKAAKAAPAPPPTSEESSDLSGLVDEFSGVMAELHGRWGHGLGHYLLAQIEESMYMGGVLDIKKQVGAGGKQVVLDGTKLGLTGKKLAGLDDFAVSFHLFSEHFNALMAKAGLAKGDELPSNTIVAAKPPEYQGN